MKLKEKYKVSESQVLKKETYKPLVKEITRIQKSLQREVNIKYGRKAPKITYRYATKEFYERCKK